MTTVGNGRFNYNERFGWDDLFHITPDPFKPSRRGVPRRQPQETNDLIDEIIGQAKVVNDALAAISANKVDKATVKADLAGYKIVEQDGKATIRIAIPGASKDSLDVSLTGNVLVVSYAVVDLATGELSKDKSLTLELSEDEYVADESYGSSNPVSYLDGVLTIRLKAVKPNKQVLPISF